MTLFTIGYEGISLEEYFNRLIKNDVKVLVDVRNNPLSMKFGFSKTQLKRFCEKLFERGRGNFIVEQPSKGSDFQAEQGSGLSLGQPQGTETGEGFPAPLQSRLARRRSVLLVKPYALGQSPLSFHPAFVLSEVEDGACQLSRYRPDKGIALKQVGDLRAGHTQEPG